MGAFSITSRRAGGGGAPTAKTATVSGSGAVYTIARLLGSSSTLSLMAGSNSNLTLSGATISATSAIANGVSQTAIVRETLGQIAIEYPITLAGDPHVSQSYLANVPVNGPAGVRADIGLPSDWNLILADGLPPEYIPTLRGFRFNAAGLSYDDNGDQWPSYAMANVSPPTGATLTFGETGIGQNGLNFYVIASNGSGDFLLVQFAHNKGDEGAVLGECFIEFRSVENWQMNYDFNTSFVDGDYTPAYRVNGDTKWSFTIDRSNNHVTITNSEGYYSVQKFPDGYTVPPEAFGLPNSQVAGSDTNVFFISSVSYTKRSGSITANEFPRRTNQLTATYKFNYTGLKPTALEHRWVNADSNVAVTGWQSGVTNSVTGTSSGTITYTATAPSAGLYKIQTRYLNDVGLVELFDNATSFGENGREALFGANIRSANYYTPVVALNNWARYADFNPDNGWLVVPFGGISGIYTVQTNTGVHFDDTIFTDPDLVIMSSNATTGVHRINFVADGTKGVVRGFKTSGNITSIRAIKEGQENQEISDEWLNAMEGAGMRTLDMGGTNDVPVLVPQVRNVDAPNDGKMWTAGSFAGSYVPFSVQCRMMAAKHARDPDFKVLWYPQPADLTDAEVLANAQYAYATLPSTVKVGLEFVNEVPWNFPANTLRLTLGGISRGYYGSGTPANPNPTIDISNIDMGTQVYGSDEDGFTDSGIPNLTGPNGGNNGTVGNSNLTGFGYTLPAGKLIIWGKYGSGNQIYKTLKQVPANTPIIEGEHFTQLAHLMEGDPARKYRAQRHLECINIWKSVYGSSFDARVAPLLMGQSGDQLGGDLLKQLELELAVPGYAAALKGIGYAWYFSDNHDDTITGDWQEPLTTAKLAAAYELDIPYMADRIESAYAAAKALGIELWMYEGGKHFAHGSTGKPYDSNNPDDPRPDPYKDATDTVFQSPEGAAVFKKAVLTMRKHTAGEHAGVVMMYDGIAGGFWSLRDHYKDNSNPRYLAWHEALSEPLTL